MRDIQNIARSVAKILLPHSVILCDGPELLEEQLSVYYHVKTYNYSRDDILTLGLVSQAPLLMCTSFPYPNTRSSVVATISAFIKAAPLILINFVSSGEEQWSSEELTSVFNEVGLDSLHQDWIRADFGNTFFLLARTQTLAQRAPTQTNDFSKEIARDRRISYATWWSHKYASWIQNNTRNAQQLRSETIQSKLLTFRPLISILLPVYRIDIDVFIHTLASVINQTYDNWEAIVVHDRFETTSLVSYLDEKARYDTRIKTLKIDLNQGISESSNLALMEAKGEYIALLDHDDVLSTSALFDIVSTLNRVEADFIFTDKDHIDANGIKVNPLFKGAWSFLTMVSGNYATHFDVIKRSLALQVGGFNPTTNGAQDWDLFLKIACETNRIIHLPTVLYSWRVLPTSTASGTSAKPYVQSAQEATLNSFFDRIRLPASVSVRGNEPIRIEWKESPIKYRAILVCEDEETFNMDKTLESISRQLHLPESVSVCSRLTGTQPCRIPRTSLNVIPPSTHEDLIMSILRALEISPELPTLLLISGVSLASPDYAMEAAHMLRFPRIYAVSGKLTDLRSRILNAGYILRPDQVLVEPFRGYNERFWTTYGSSEWYRDYSAVQSEAMMVNTATFLKALRAVCSSYPNGVENIRDLLVLAQIVHSNTGARSAYHPFVTATWSGNYATPLLPSDLLRTTFDPHFNHNVWDWSLSSYDVEVSN